MDSERYYDFIIASLSNKTNDYIMANTISLASFLSNILNDQNINFDQTISVISANYNYQPTEFRNGLNENKLINAAGSNEGSCKIFAFALIHQLNKQQTLKLFGDFYTIDVLENPSSSDHQNIRNFMQYGWEGISFTKPALIATQDSKTGK